MKRILALFFCLIAVCQLFGCRNVHETQKDKLQIVTTVFPLYDFAKNVAGDKADVTLLLPVGAEAHSYEPTIQDMVKINECDLFINLGSTAEPWCKSIIEGEAFKGVTVSAMNCVELYKEEHKHSLGYEFDQHVWTSPENAQEITEEIEKALSRIDKRNMHYYESNAEKYEARLEALDEKFDKLTENMTKTVVFADSFPFRYFAEEYDLKCFAAYPGCSSESEPSAATVAELIDKVREEKIKVIFYTETSNGQLPNSICEETGAQMKLFHSCHTVTKEEFNSGITYLDLMEANYNALKSAK